MIQIREDHGQQLPIPENKVIGFADTEEAFQAITGALTCAGYPDSKIAAMHGRDGIELLERLRDVAFFGDWERAVVDAGIAELERGGYSIAVAVADREEAQKVAGLATANGGHSFNYFGKFVNEQLTK